MTRYVAAVGSVVRAFYESSPFPDYEEFETSQDLLDKARQGVYARMLDTQIPLGVRILDAGCGTGQIAVFLSLTHRTVVGMDFSLASLQCGHAFKSKFNLGDVHFVQMDLFNLGWRSSTFDLVMANGVLHHTAASEEAFGLLCKLLKPEGYIVVGLYNSYGRLLHNLRKAFYKMTGLQLEGLMWPRRMGKRKRQAWFLDQYEHPHEVTVSVDEVLGWFRKHGIEYVSSVPRINMEDQLALDAKLFTLIAPGSRLMHLLVQLTWIFTLHREGGYFVTIGRKSG